MNDIPRAAHYSVMPGLSDTVIELQSSLERTLLQNALNCEDIPLMRALELIYAGSAVLVMRDAGEIHFEDGVNVLQIKGVFPETMAILGARRFGLVDSWGDPAGVLEARHVWLRHNFADRSADYDRVIAPGRPGARGSYKATIVGDHENISVYSAFVGVAAMRQRVRVTTDVARTMMEFRRRVGTGEI